MADARDDDFLSRWSRRKRGEHAEPEPADPVAEVAEVADGDPPDADAGDAGDPEVVARLPDIGRMDDASDFTVFLQAGVPEGLRRRALRKLWRVNPVLANLDGLNNYDEDYTKLHTLGRGMKTLYQVGKGFVTDEGDAPAESEPPSAAADDPETRLPEESASDEAERQADPVDMTLNRANRADPHVRESAESEPERKSAARIRRWGTSEKQS
jgi:hypothetical protein